MIRVAIFLGVFALAFSAKESGGPLWPVFFALAVYLTACSAAMGRRADAFVSGSIGLGILAMLAPFTGVWWSLYAVALWTLIALLVSRLNRWSALFILPMPVGYALLYFFPGETGIWAIVEISGVIALLITGRGSDEAIRMAGRGLRSLAGIAARGGSDAGNRRD